MITVFTPTYNRENLIGRLYESLKTQTNKDFEWIVVDDGSTDKTEELFQTLLSGENEFPIKYIKKGNGGKHTAINLGVQEAKGEMFIIVDSDDWLADNAVEIIINDYKTLPKEGFAGLGYNRSYTNGEMIGRCHSKKFIDATSLERGKIGLQGDKAEVFFTDCLKKYPFPVFLGEKFVPEALVWGRMANDGLKIRWYNKSFYFCAYQATGLSMSNPELKSFEGYTLMVKEFLHYKGVQMQEKIKTLGVFVENAHLKGMKNAQISRLLQVNRIAIVLSHTIYKVVKKLRRKNRAQQLKINK
jgi:glycosyltransferase involved in cell wall biosynthesis